MLELEQPGDAAGARYRGAIYTPSLRADYHVGFDEAGVPTLVPSGEPPVRGDGTPTEETVNARAVELLRSIARTVGRHAVAATPASWPYRVLRWRRLG